LGLITLADGGEREKNGFLFVLIAGLFVYRVIIDMIIIDVID
jgi:hypothetical protein